MHILNPEPTVSNIGPKGLMTLCVRARYLAKTVRVPICGDLVVDEEGHAEGGDNPVAGYGFRTERKLTSQMPCSRSREALTAILNSQPEIPKP